MSILPGNPCGETLLKRYLPFIVLVVGILLDQGSKIAVRNHFQPVEELPFYAMTHDVLEAFGLGEADITPEYLKPDQAADRMKDGAMDAFFFVGGYPAGAIAELATSSESIDQFYAEVQAMGGGRQDTSALVRRLPRRGKA